MTFAASVSPTWTTAIMLIRYWEDGTDDVENRSSYTNPQILRLQWVWFVTAKPLVNTDFGTFDRTDISEVRLANLFPGSWAWTACIVPQDNWLWVPDLGMINNICLDTACENCNVAVECCWDKPSQRVKLARMPGHPELNHGQSMLRTRMIGWPP